MSTRKKTPKKSSSRKSSRRSTRNKGAKFSPQKADEPEGKYVSVCKNLLHQITSNEDSKPFHDVLKSSDTLYKVYKKLVPDPVTFRVIHDKLHESPCDYGSYEEFNSDVETIFAQERLLTPEKIKKCMKKKGKKRKAKNNEEELIGLAKERMRKATTTENYWNTLTASYREYGFDAVVNYQPDSISGNSDSKENSENDTGNGDTSTHQNNINNSNNSNSLNNSNSSIDTEEEVIRSGKRKLSVSPTPNQSLLQNLKKRVLSGNSETPNKRRKLNDESVESVSTTSNTSKEEEDDDAKLKEIETPRKATAQEEDDSDIEITPFRRHRHNSNSNSNSNSSSNSRKERSSSVPHPGTPFTPFSENSEVFQDLFGNTGGTDILYQKASDVNAERNGVKQRLFFTEEQQRKKPMHRYKVHYRMDGKLYGSSERFDEIEAVRLDFAMRAFRLKRPKAKLISCLQMDSGP